MVGSSLSARGARPLLSMFRFMPGQDRLIELLSVEWVHLSTHWVKRSLVCPGAPGCPICGVQSPRARWYLPALEIRTKRVGLLEFSAQASAQVEQACRFQLSAWSAGCQVVLSRRTTKSPLRACPEGITREARGLKLPEWFNPLMKVYDLPELQEEETLEEYSVRLAPTVTKRAELAFAVMGPGSIG